MLVPASAALLHTELAPRFDYVLIRPVYRTVVTEAGLELPSEAVHDNIGEVLAVGPWCLDTSLAPEGTMIQVLIPGTFVIYKGTHHTVINGHLGNEHSMLSMRNSAIELEIKPPERPIVAQA